ncbi:MAG: peptidase U32 family protein [Bacillota bacterium]
MNKPELLAPAGNLEKLEMALAYGADAVYCGGTAYGLRTRAGNFTLDELAKGITLAHGLGKRVYVTVNIIPHNDDLIGLDDYLKQLAEIKVDALIVSDPGILTIAQRAVPGMELHFSTQASVTNWATSQFWFDHGVRRIVLARELSLAEISDVVSKTSGEIETFIHGAMCISYSGRCLLSSYMTGRDANRGDCAQACRWNYHLVEETRPGQYMPVFEDEQGTHIMNSKDLCLIEHVPDLVEAGIHAFKIEGRMKSVHYVATVTKVYREAIDHYCADPAGYRFNPSWLDEIAKASHRDYTTGFYFQQPGADAHNYASSLYKRPVDFVGVVRASEGGFLTIEQRNNFRVGEKLELVGPTSAPREIVITAMTDSEGTRIEVAPHAQMLVHVPYEGAVEPYAMLRRVKASD